MTIGSVGMRDRTIVIVGVLALCLAFGLLLRGAFEEDEARAWFDWPMEASHAFREQDWEKLADLVATGARIERAGEQGFLSAADLLAAAPRESQGGSRLYATFPDRWTRRSDELVSIDFFLVIERGEERRVHRVSADLSRRGSRWLLAAARLR